MGKNAFLEGQDFVFILCLKHVFMGTTHFGGIKDIWGGTAPECPPVTTGLNGHDDLHVRESRFAEISLSKERCRFQGTLLRLGHLSVTSSFQKTTCLSG